MKFAKELEQELVPEWRAKYLNYKAGKKKLKAVARALRNVQSQTPRTPRRRGPNFFVPSPFESAPTYSFINRSRLGRGGGAGDGSAQDLGGLVMPASAHPRARARDSGDGISTSGVDPEEQPLSSAAKDARLGSGRMARYGSIISTPPRGSPKGSPKGSLADSRGRRPSTLNLPEPALSSDSSPDDVRRPSSPLLSRRKQAPFSQQEWRDAFQMGENKPSPNQKLANRHRSIFHPKRVNSMPGTEGARPLIKRVLSLGGSHGTPSSPRDTDVPLEAYREVDFRQAEFFNFLDMELEKIEAFYKQKENEATERLKMLRDQLHIMRDRRIEDLIAIRTAKIKHSHNATEDGLLTPKSDDEQRKSNGNTLGASFLKPLDRAIETARKGRVGKATKAMEQLGTPPGPRPIDALRDYGFGRHSADISYREAKRKLKVALQEYYRGLELLKSYVMLNQTAFRKINKKYDKTMNARPSNRYTVEKVNRAYFVQSEVLDGHIRATEDLYARYFERGNHKAAAGKLRAKIARAGDYTASVFRSGLSLGAGAVFGIEGLVYGAELLYSSDPTLRVNTSYLLQIYAGYFFLLMLFLLFCLCCRFWQRAKINYVFIFEFDTRHHLDWRQVAELPCFFLFLNGLFMWINFNRFGPDVLYTWYPIILIGITVLILFFPAPVLYHHSRRWFLYSSWRLLWAGFYPVEFRDFFLGDMLCSQTYSIGQIAVSMCLYAHEWTNPGQCNSSHSRAQGFLTTLPGIWRALQCLRRYYDTRNIFPHLVNCGKYTWTILFYMSLSLYRIDQTSGLKAFFIFCATINGIYCSIWDLVMDWSLGDPYARYPFLRQTLGYKQIWMYYAAMVIDPILRFNWIFYAIFTNELQHSALLSFFVSFSEILRRGMWTLFRVENEHCTNVGRFRASRDIPLPYEVLVTSDTRIADATMTIPEEPSPRDESPTRPVSRQTTASRTTGADLEQARTRDTTASSTRRRRREGPPLGPGGRLRALSYVGSMLHRAHAQDFERKRRPEIGEDKDEAGKQDVSSDEEDPEVQAEVEAQAMESVEQATREERKQEMSERNGEEGLVDGVGEGEGSGSS